MFMWREFDRSFIEEDLAIITDLGISGVRIFLLWEDFQPEPKKTPAIMLDRLVDFLEIADNKNLVVMPTLFTGYMCGLRWLPPWMLLASTELGQYSVFSMDKVRNNRIRNPYVDSEVIEAQIFFLRELLTAVAGHPALSAWNLGNVPSLWSTPPGEFSAELWLQTMTETLKEKDETIPATLGLHVSDLTESDGLKPMLVAKYLDFLAIHVPHRVPWTKDRLDAALPSFLGCIVGWLGKIPVLIQEFGLAMGIFWKTYGDYHPSIWDWPPLDRRERERFFGLVRYDGSPKLAASVFKSKPTGPEEDEVYLEWIDLPEEDYYRNPRKQLARLYRRFRAYYSFG